MLEQFGEAAITGMAGSWGATNQPQMGTIAANGSYTVMHKMYLSMFSCGKMLPTRYAPLELEISVNPVTSDWLSTAAGTSQTFTVSNIQLIYDVIEVDEAVSESMYKSLLSGRVLSVPTMTVYQVSQTIPNGSTSYSFTTVRAFSRLSHVWLTFRVAGGRSASFICPTTVTANSGATPVLSDGVNSPSARLSIGPHYWPDPAPANTIPELFYMFQKALPGVPNITRDNYLQDAFTIVFDVRKVPTDPTSSISTRSGDLLRIDLNNLVTPATGPQMECFCTCLLYTSPSPRDRTRSRMPSSA